jgi:hypothetical protein
MDANDDLYYSEPILLELAVEDDGTAPSNSSWLGSLTGTLLSVVFHLWLLFTLSGIVFNDRQMLDPEPIDTRFTNAPTIEQQPEIIDYELANPDDREMEVRKAVNAMSVGAEISTKPNQESAPVPYRELQANPELKSLPMYDIPQGRELSKTVVVPGTTGEALIQLDTALDRVTWEIARNLQEKKVLIVWLIDASGSLGPQRQALHRRLKRIYGELDALEQAEQIPRLDQPILSGVVAFGSKTTFVTKEPTDKFEVLQEAIRSSPIDETGVENAFGAVNHGD